MMDDVVVLVNATASIPVTAAVAKDTLTSIASAPFTLPDLPSYTLQPLQPLVPWIPDKYLNLLLPIVAYWALSMVFHYIDVFDLFPHYRLHTPAEVLKRNRVSRWEVVRDVVIQQIVQTAVGMFLAAIEEDAMVGKDDYNVAVWAQRIRLAQTSLPRLFALFGLDSLKLADRALTYSPQLAGALAGGRYLEAATSFTDWEMSSARFIYWFLVPALQFCLAICIVDTWQYFLHRAMHMNKFLYTTFHSRHHRLYVPYAYGALYNHPFEGFLLDTVGAGIGYLVSGMTVRQAMWFFTCSTIKTVDDHCGYALPWDPLQHLTSNNAGYHDVHHQSWGIKTNFSQPFFTFWDRFLGTCWTGGDVSLRYERARKAADEAVRKDQAPITGSETAKSAVEDCKPYTPAPLDETAPLVEDVQSPEERSSLIAAEPAIPAGKAEAQANESRIQVVEDDSPAGGASVIIDETQEEIEERQEVMKNINNARKEDDDVEDAPAVAAVVAQDFKEVRRLSASRIPISTKELHRRRSSGRTSRSPTPTSSPITTTPPALPSPPATQISSPMMMKGLRDRAAGAGAGAKRHGRHGRTGGILGLAMENVQ